VEAHVNLRQPQKVRIYNSTQTPQDFETSAGRGNLTSRLIRKTPYHIIAKRNPPTDQLGKWGLQYFVRFHGGVGFHSNICYPLPKKNKRKLKVDGTSVPKRNQTKLIVDGTPHSHGCLRLQHTDSQTVYNALSVSDNVYIYNSESFHRPSWEAASTSSHRK
jgi:hypothetical protein